MLMSLHTERRSGFMKWLCNFLKGPKPGEPNRRRSQVTAGEEEDALWHQRPVRPKVLHCTSNLVPPFLYNSSLCLQTALWSIHTVPFHIFTSNSTCIYCSTILSSLIYCSTILPSNKQLLKTIFLCCFQNDPPRNDNEELDHAIAESLAEDAKPPKGTWMNQSIHFMSAWYKFL